MTGLTIATSIISADAVVNPVTPNETVSLTNLLLLYTWTRFYKIENSQNLQDELQTTKFLNNSKLFNYQYFLELKTFKLDFLIIHTIPEYHNSKQSNLGSIIFTIL